jgi:hypothetical protein
MPNLGRKYTCYSCHTKFYDLGKPEPKCPKCGADQRDAEDAPVVTSHRGRARVVEEPEEPELAADSEDAEETPPPALAGDDEEVELPETPEKEEEDSDEDEEY